MNKSILVIGSTNIDLVTQVDRLPVEGETLLSNRFERLCGGKGANQAYACGMLGGKTSFLGAVGEDSFGTFAVDNLKKAGVDCEGVKFCKEESTGLALICVDKKGSNSIVVVPGANCQCTWEYTEGKSNLLEEADIIMAQLEIPTDCVYNVLKKAFSEGKITILNPAPAPESIPDWVYPNLCFITPNETELQKLTGMPVGTPEEILTAARSLLSKGVKNVIATLGKRGAMLVNKDTEAVFDPPSVPAVDTTAAGDTFNGALAVQLAEGKSLEEAIRFANGAAALSVSRKGAQVSIPTRQETEAFLKTLI
jgi:ribokinase